MASTRTSANNLFQKPEHGLVKPSHGQSELIDDIVKILCGTKVRIVEISGPSGIGKSFVAEKVSHRMNEQFRGSISVPKNIHARRELQIYPVQLRNNSSVAEMAQNLSSLLNFSTTDGRTRSLCRSLKQQTQKGIRYLLIFENVEAFVFPMNTNSDQLAQFLDFCNELAHETNNVYTILTTQIKLDFVRNLTSIVKRSVPALSENESAYLIKAVLEPQVNLSNESTSEVFKQSAGNPRKVIEIGLQMRRQFLIYGASTEIRGDSQIPTIISASDTKAATRREIQLCDTIMILDDIGRQHRNNLVTLAYFPGSFSPEAATAVLGAQKTSFVKHDILTPLHSTYLILGEGTPIHRFTIQPFLRHFLEEMYLLYRSSDAKVRNRFCVFFAHLLKQMTHMELVDRFGESISLFNLEIDNIQKLLLEAVHCMDENYELFFDIAYNAEYYIINLLPKKESVEFYEAMCGAARRHSPRQYGIMLSSFGQVLEFAQTRNAEAYQQYMRALDYLRPLGESTDLAWLYSHIGFAWHTSGKFKKAER